MSETGPPRPKSDVVHPRGKLSTIDHTTDRVGMTYVYPVVSRRSGGVSIGVNLNPNHACNFRCAYCQVENLTRGKGPAIDRAQLATELHTLVDDVLDGDFMTRAVPEDVRKLVSLAYSGDGEPTSSPDFEAVVCDVNAVVAAIRARQPLRYMLITNGSLTHLPAVERGLDALREGGGEVWFKLDAGTDEAQRRVNDTKVGIEKTLANLVATSKRVPTYVQTFFGRFGGTPPPDDEIAAYVRALSRALNDGAVLKGVLLYTLARPSLQPEAAVLEALTRDELDSIADRIRATGLRVDVSS
jgi:wyosine [tRNA(Phe)-imidazoG37] synthetase (radical SAM superfamily)